jgi:hypothetical protein
MIETRCPRHPTANGPIRRQRPFRRLTTVENRLDDVGREQGEPQDTADVRRVDLFGGDFLDGREYAALGPVANGCFRRATPAIPDGGEESSTLFRFLGRPSSADGAAGLSDGRRRKLKA